MVGGHPSVYGCEIEVWDVELSERGLGGGKS